MRFYEENITAGKTAATFAPNENCTHGQILTFLWRAAGEPESSAQPPTAMKGNEYYYKAAKWAAENGITTGTSATAFNPGGICTRGQIVTFLYRAYK